MNRVAAASDEFEDFIEPVLASWNFDSRTRIKAEMDQTCYVSKVEAAKLVVIWNVDKNSIVRMVR